MDVSIVRPDCSARPWLFGAGCRYATTLQNRLPSALIAVLTLGVIGGTLAGCSGDTSGTAPSGNATTPVSVTLNQHAINMSLTPPSNTIQLTMTARNVDGKPLATTGQVTFGTVDSSVSVSPSGLVTARFTTPDGGTEVIAAMQMGNAVYMDTAFIRVTATPPAVGIATFSIQPVDGDSAVRTVRSQYFPTISSLDSLGNIVPFNANTIYGTDNVYWLATSNRAIADYQRNDPGGFSLNDTGHVTLYATSWVYGIAVQDSLKFTVGWQLSILNVRNTTGPCGWNVCTPFIGVGGVIQWVQNSTDSVDVIFEDSTVVDSAANLFGQYTGRGNVYLPPFVTLAPIQARRFSVAGRYHFYSRLFPDDTGTIFVLNNPK